MTDRELLEWAAKAAGFKPRDQWAYDDEWGIKVSEGPPPYEWWNPLTDDGTAFRLAMRLRITPTMTGTAAYADVAGMESICEPFVTDKYAAARRAITRAAASIGKSMSEVPDVEG